MHLLQGIRICSAIAVFGCWQLAAGEREEFFTEKIYPLFHDHCFKCHSHDADKIKGGLVLDSLDGALTGGDTGPAIVPGNPEKSLLIKAVRYSNEVLQMPP